MLLPPRAAACLVSVLLVPSCRSGSADRGPQIIQPGAPGQSSRVITAARASDLSNVQHTPADVRFMQGMIGHHAQALEMTALVPSRSSSDALRALALRIELSQADEIDMMKEWLTRRREPLPDPHAHHADGALLMPGMLTPGDMRRLSGASGVEFDKLFLSLMIRHHEGALKMVQDLFAAPGAGQQAEIFAFASDVDADQRMEIDRMRSVLVTAKEPQA